jgi:hypothetical protein
MPTIAQARTAMNRLWTLNRDAVIWRRERRRTLDRPKEYWESLPEVVFSETTPGFFLSTGRCGTKLISDVLARMKGVACYHAPRTELVWSERMAYEEGLEQFEAYRTAIRVARFELVADAYIRERRYVETNYRVTFYAPHLHDLFPRSRFVHLVRHPGSFIRSAVRHDYYGGMWTDIGRIRPAKGPLVERWEGMDPFAKAAWLWNETNEFIERFKEREDGDRVLTVKAEDLFGDAATLERILLHLELEPPSRAKIERWTAKPVNVQPGGRPVKPWTEWPEERKAELRALLPGAARYGYSL